VAGRIYKGIADLKRLVGKYKFKDAGVVLEGMIKDLRKIQNRV
jgi:hypothetical protein